MSVNTSNNRASRYTHLCRRLSTAATVLATATAPAALVVLATQPGCAIFGSPGPSAVGQGHEYASGNPGYDRYFTRLHERQVEMAKAPDREKHIRRALATKLGIDQDASASMLARNVKKEAKRLEKRGITLKLEITGENGDTPASAKLGVSGGKLTGDAKGFTEAVKKAVEREARLAAKMKKSRKALDHLHTRAIELKANVDTVFHKEGLHKQAEVRKNLDDAGTLITLMIARADEVSDNAAGLAKQLAVAINTDQGQFKETEAEEPGGKTEKKPARKPRKQWHRPPHHGGSPPAAHKPPPKPASPPPPDFEP